MWLIIRLQQAEDTDLKNPVPPLAQFSVRQRADVGVTIGGVADELTDHGYELGPVVGARTTKQDWPITAIVYTSQRKDGVGRSGSQVHRWPVRERGEDHDS